MQQVRYLFSKKRGQKNLAAAAGASAMEQNYHFEEVTRDISSSDGLFDMDAVLEAAAAREPAPPTPTPSSNTPSSAPEGGTANFKPPSIFVAKKRVKDEPQQEQKEEIENIMSDRTTLPEVSFFQNMKLTPQEEIALLRQLLAMRSGQASSADSPPAGAEESAPQQQEDTVSSTTSAAVVEPVKEEIKETKLQQKMRLLEEKNQEKKKKAEAVEQAQIDGELWGREVIALIEDQLLKEICATLPRAENHSLFEKRVWATVTAIPPGQVTTVASIAAIVRAREALDGEWSHDDILAKLQEASQSRPPNTLPSVEGTSPTAEADPLEELKSLPFVSPSTPEQALVYVRASGLARASTADVTKIIYKCPVKLDTHRIIKATGQLYATTDKQKSYMAKLLESEGVVINTGRQGMLSVDASCIWVPHVDFEKRKQKQAEAAAAFATPSSA